MGAPGERPAAGASLRAKIKRNLRTRPVRASAYARSLEGTTVLMLEAAAALLLTVASVLVIVAVIAADRGDRPERADETADEARRWDEAA